MISALVFLLSALSNFTASARARLRSDDGLEAIEYALIAALVAAAVIAAVTALNPNLTNAFTTIGARVSAWATAIGAPN